MQRDHMEDKKEREMRVEELERIVKELSTQKKKRGGRKKL